MTQSQIKLFQNILYFPLCPERIRDTLKVMQSFENRNIIIHYIFQLQYIYFKCIDIESAEVVFSKLNYNAIFKDYKIYESAYFATLRSA